MSREENEFWLEAAKEMFDEAIEKEDWTFARAVIGDVRDISPSVAAILDEVLVKAQPK